MSSLRGAHQCASAICVHSSDVCSGFQQPSYDFHVAPVGGQGQRGVACRAPCVGVCTHLQKCGNGFIIADFSPEAITLKFFRFNYYRQAADDIDRLEPFRTTELKRPG